MTTPRRPATRRWRAMAVGGLVVHAVVALIAGACGVQEAPKQTRSLRPELYNASRVDLLGVVVDQTGQPLNGVTLFIEVNRPFISQAGYPIGNIGRDQRPVDGTFEVHDAGVLWIRLTFSCPGYVSQSLMYLPSADNYRDAIDCNLRVMLLRETPAP